MRIAAVRRRFVSNMGCRRVSLTNHKYFSSLTYWIKNLLTVTTTSFTLAPATATQILPADSTRQLLLRATTGANPATWKFGSVGPASATDGLVLDTTTLAGGRILLTGASTPIDAVWAYSQLGTNVVVEVGKTNGF
jgi:hypothetical protein